MNFPFNWVDVAIVVFLAFGIFRGRKHGLSQELVIMIQWLAIIFACAFLHQPIGEFLASFSALNLSLLFSLIASYLAVAAVIKIIFALIKSSAGGKLIGSDVFGAGEYYFGMAGALVRYVCMVIFAMALLNAKLVSEAETKATVASQIKLYDKDYFSIFRVDQLQLEVFENSFSGRFVKEQLSTLLITPTEAGVKERHQKEFQMP